MIGVTRLAFALFSVVLATHYGYEPAAEIVAKASTWFYIFRGLEGMVIFLAMMALIPRQYLDARAVCAWGAIEEALTSACRLGVGVTNPPSSRSQCDAITGLPIYSLTLVAVLWVLVLSTKER